MRKLNKFILTCVRDRKLFAFILPLKIKIISILFHIITDHQKNLTVFRKFLFRYFVYFSIHKNECDHDAYNLGFYQSSAKIGRVTSQYEWCIIERDTKTIYNRTIKHSIYRFKRRIIS